MRQWWWVVVKRLCEVRRRCRMIRTRRTSTGRFSTGPTLWCTCVGTATRAWAWWSEASPSGSVHTHWHCCSNSVTQSGSVHTLLVEYWHSDVQRHWHILIFTSLLWVSVSQLVFLSFGRIPSVSQNTGETQFFTGSMLLWVSVQQTASGHSASNCYMPIQCKCQLVVAACWSVWRFVESFYDIVTCCWLQCSYCEYIHSCVAVLCLKIHSCF